MLTCLWDLIIILKSKFGLDYNFKIEDSGIQCNFENNLSFLDNMRKHIKYDTIMSNLSGYELETIAQSCTYCNYKLTFDEKYKYFYYKIDENTFNELVICKLNK